MSMSNTWNRSLPMFAVCSLITAVVVACGGSSGGTSNVTNNTGTTKNASPVPTATAQPTATAIVQRDTMLHLQGIDISPANYRRYIDKEVVGDPVFGPAVCKALQGVLVDVILSTEANGDNSPGDMAKLEAYGGVVKAGQQVDTKDERASIQIVLDECNN